MFPDGRTLNMGGLSVQRNVTQLKKIEMLTPATTWRKLEDTVLSEINQSQKDRYWVIPLT